jgi:hypothetical protein
MKTVLSLDGGVSGTELRSTCAFGTKKNLKQPRMRIVYILSSFLFGFNLFNFDWAPHL